MTGTGERPAAHGTGLAWFAAIAVAAIGAYIMFDALPGVNWGIWTAFASLGLGVVMRARGTLNSSSLLMLAIASVLASGASITAAEFIHALSFLGVVLFLTLAMLFAVGPSLERMTAAFVISAPFVAAGNALAESFRRFSDLSNVFRSTRSRAAVRGAVITIPVVLFFALLLASADPVFGSWRDEIARIIATWEFIPRTIFFFVLLVVTLGAYSFAALHPIRQSSSLSPVSGSEGVGRWLGATERLILVSGVAALFWLFIGVQLSYLFGNAPSEPGSGITFAEYARRGFGELTIVATCSVILILVSERFGRVDDHAGRIKILTLAILVAVLIMLASAFHRVSLYEAAYGYTVSRLYAQVYMLVLAVALIALAAGILGTLDIGSLFRRVFTVAVAAFLVLVFWNHEAWIASANMDRVATTGKLDARYIARDLSPDAIPVIVTRLQSLPEPVRGQLHAELVARYGNPRRLAPGRWFEWNLRREQAREALRRIGLPRTS
ncbi:MAG: DUF4173 domain-containing protein [Gemmatimonadota bacterium]|nr:DUF4173 domain-containing protein [Gemmatimonadota bacterium]